MAMRGLGIDVAEVSRTTVLRNSHAFRSYQMVKVGIAVNMVVSGKPSGSLPGYSVSEQALLFKRSIRTR
ncbi:hypothetical protein BGAL_0452g00090 [Botrytis galanthina]|uniref:Uncharacterized protein n=1 Tax=Botrytis galanthina TaxID=278940 RepID=A0A4S8QLI2_9HELO|nr:hypothetical protein BGAL_0452g00090 [Botrytis galanthina]